MTERRPPPEGTQPGELAQVSDIEGMPLPDELTGRASKTDDDLATLFDNDSQEHLKDGFRGGSGEEEPAGS
jgi:hypothetical protein